MYASYCAKRVHFAQYGVPRGFVYNSVQYFYITNQLGDIPLEVADDPEADDAEYRDWKQVTKKARAAIVAIDTDRWKL